MINVKMLGKEEGINIENLQCCKYYSCKKKTSEEREIFILIPSEKHPMMIEYEKRIVIYFSKKFNNQGLVWDYFSSLKQNCYDFQEVKDAELTFYV